MAELHDARVVESWGGGWAPEQHTGTLTDGRRFYFRMRHGDAQLHVATIEECEADAQRDKANGHWSGKREGKAYPPIVNPEWDSAAFDAAYAAGEEYGKSFWGGEVKGESVYDREPNDQYVGAFENQEDRDASFKRLLDQIEASRDPS